jgi:hypothetical protein
METVRVDSAVAQAAEWYAVHRRWSVLPGTSHVGGGRCSCGVAACPRPGAHPAIAQWRTLATNRREEIRSRWTGQPGACIVLPTGGLFDVLDVPGYAGWEALSRLQEAGYRLGPVAETAGDRLLVWVATGTRILYGLGDGHRWPFDSLDMHCLSSGDYVVAPPSPGARWVFAPDATSWYLPQVEQVAATIAAACRHAAHT